MNKQPKPNKQNKKPTRKADVCDVWKDGTHWKVCYGKLSSGRGRPRNLKSLFRVVGEKLPFDAVDTVRKHLVGRGQHMQGVYIAHDSMGYARYVGRGSIFTRLKAHKKAHPDELFYFSFYVVSEKLHEREVETLLIRAAGPLLVLNTKKKRVMTDVGNVRDFEAGTQFYERQRKRGAKSKRKTIASRQ